MTASVYYSECCNNREEIIKNTIGDGSIIDSFLIDNLHPMGAEIHSVTDTGVIIITNALTDKLITKIIARPAQIKKLYGEYGIEPPKKVLEAAYRNNRKGLNRL